MGLTWLHVKISCIIKSKNDIIFNQIPPAQDDFQTLFSSAGDFQWTLADAEKREKTIATIRLNQFKTYWKSINQELDITDAPYFIKIQQTQVTWDNLISMLSQNPGIKCIKGIQPQVHEEESYS